MAAITMEDIIESNHLKKEGFNALRNDMKGIMSKAQLDKLEEVFMSCTDDYLFRRKGN